MPREPRTMNITDWIQLGLATAAVVFTAMTVRLAVQARRYAKQARAHRDRAQRAYERINQLRGDR